MWLVTDKELYLLQTYIRETKERGIVQTEYREGKQGTERGKVRKEQRVGTQPHRQNGQNQLQT